METSQAAQTNHGVSLAEWRRFRVELLSVVSQGFREDESAIREHVLMQLPEPWRLAVVKQEMKRKAHSAMVRVGIPLGEDAERLFWELSAEVDGLVPYETEGRSIRIECGNRAVQAKILELNGFFCGSKVERASYGFVLANHIAQSKKFVRSWINGLRNRRKCERWRANWPSHPFG